MKILTLGILVSLAVLEACSSSPGSSPIVKGTTPIKHVIIIMKENRSFDHMFGKFPGVNGATSGLCGNTNLALYSAPDVVAHDLGHERASSLLAIDGGKMDGFCEVANGGDTPPRYANIGIVGWASSTVDDPSTADNRIEGRHRSPPRHECQTAV